MTDRDLVEQAMAYLRKTTVKYTAANEKNPATNWGKAFAVLKEIGIEPEPPAPAPGLMWPRDPLTLYASGNGKTPVRVGDTLRCEVTGPGISRGHYEIALKVGDPFSISERITWDGEPRGTYLRIEDEPDEINQHRLELDRFRDGLWYVVRNRNKSVADEHTPILGPFDIPNGAHVEIRGKLSPVDLSAYTELRVNGIRLDDTRAPNWSSTASLVARRARYGIVEGSQSGACVVTVSEISFQGGVK